MAALINIGSQGGVPFVAEFFPHINVHKIRMIELEVKGHGTEVV